MLCTCVQWMYLDIHNFESLLGSSVIDIERFTNPVSSVLSSDAPRHCFPAVVCSARDRFYRLLLRLRGKFPAMIQQSTSPESPPKSYSELWSRTRNIGGRRMDRGWTPLLFRSRNTGWLRTVDKDSAPAAPCIDMRCDAGMRTHTGHTEAHRRKLLSTPRKLGTYPSWINGKKKNRHVDVG